MHVPCQVRIYWEHDLRAGSYSRVTLCRPLSMLLVVSLAWVIRVGLVPLPLLLTGGAIGGMVLLVSRAWFCWFPGHCVLPPI